MPADRPFNLISVISTADEFVFAGTNLAPALSKARSLGTCLLADLLPAGPARKTSRSFSLVFDGPGSVCEGPEGKVFDLEGTHFGHSLKFYANWLRDIGFAGVIQRVLGSRGVIDLEAIFNSAQEEGELKLPGPPQQA